MNRNKKMLAVALVAVMLLALLCACGQQTEEAAFTVKLTVDCKDAVDYGYEAAKNVAEDGNIYSGEVGVPENGTAVDALKAAGLVVAVEDSEYGPYVSSIASLAQGDCGSSSGWTFMVNGEYPPTSAGDTVLSEGDEVVWTLYCEPQN